MRIAVASDHGGLPIRDEIDGAASLRESCARLLKSIETRVATLRKA